MIKGLFSKLGRKAESAPAASVRSAGDSSKKAGSGTAGGKSGHKGSNQQTHGERGKPRKQGPKKGHQAKKAKPVNASKPWSLDEFQVPEQEGKTRFHDMDLPLTLMQGIAKLGFEYCTPIQAKTLPFTLQGHDVIGKAQTGTGKTAAFLLTIITDLLNKPVEHERYAGEPRALVIAPTRELVLQIAKDAEGLCKFTGLNICTLIGGTDFQKQQQRLNDRLVDIVVATPGRLIDFCERGHLHLDMVEVLVLDEADRMLDMGFIPQVRRIVRKTPQKSHRQTLLFSATFTPDVLSLAEQWTYEAHTVEIEPERVATDNVEQKLFAVTESDKLKLLVAILGQPEVESAIVFANRRDQTRRLFERLQKKGMQVGMLSGEVPQNKRTKTLEQFRNGHLKVLVATDVAGRGIHIDGISHVINYTLPEEPDDYVHRIGRTGRAGAKGVSISLLGEEDAFNLMPIEELLGHKLQCEQAPESLLS